MQAITTIRESTPTGKKTAQVIGPSINLIITRCWNNIDTLLVKHSHGARHVPCRSNKNKR